MRLAIATIAALALSIGAAHAQNSNANANSNTTQVQQQSQSGAGAVVNFSPSTQVDNPDRIHTTPPVYAPGMDAGTNPCAVGASAGFGVTGFGGSVGHTWTDEDCNQRNWFALLTARGMNDVAIQYACFQNAEVATALRTAGYKCQDHPDYEVVQEQVSQYPEDKTRRSGVPAYCDDGGLASEATIRKNCPNPKRTLKKAGLF